jgi:hypothetical protein
VSGAVTDPAARSERTAAPSAALSLAEAAETAAWIASVQLPTGMIPWYPGGHADAWNHTEAAMALALAGRVAEAEAAYEWLRSAQQPDGSWCLYHLAEGIEEPRRDPNVGAYVATGVWWQWLSTGDRGFLEAMWPTVAAAVDFALSLQAPGGEIRWSRDVDGHVGRFALVTANSSIAHSLRCAVSIAASLGWERPEWELAADRVACAIDRYVRLPGAGSGLFESKDRWAMDWYYPVLGGALGPVVGHRRIEAGWDTFVMPGLGVRCVSDHNWVTAAETAELVMALDAVGESERAAEVLGWTRHLREADGAYATGRVHPPGNRFPGGERSTYSAAAVLMADHVLWSSAPTAGVFRPPAAAPALSPSLKAAAAEAS